MKTIPRHAYAVLLINSAVNRLRRSFSLWLPEVELLDEVWCKGEDVGKHPEGLGWVKTKIRLKGILVHEDR